ncbi:MAG: 7-cyano-7-deazaguanine synthase [Candidatus Marsarchaeota archaeon]|nr:7-cyano-7-deazaguanine synthase [Candidatus Marsarchaeota archaeon]
MKVDGVILLSGGLDSAICAHYLLDKRKSLHALTLNYFGRRIKEKKATTKLAHEMGIPLTKVDVGFLKEASDVAALAQKIERRAGAYIPARNLIFYGIAAHYAERLGASKIYGGHLREDSLTFPDASIKFFERLNESLSEAQLTTKLSVELPLIHMSKAEVIRLGAQLKVPFEYTWSCYTDGRLPCGRCPACISRSNAFREAGVTDPLASHSKSHRV